MVGKNCGPLLAQGRRDRGLAECAANSPHPEPVEGRGPPLPFTFRRAPNPAFPAALVRLPRSFFLSSPRKRGPRGHTGGPSAILQGQRIMAVHHGDAATRRHAAPPVNDRNPGRTHGSLCPCQSPLVIPALSRDLWTVSMQGTQKGGIPPTGPGSSLRSGRDDQGRGAAAPPPRRRRDQPSLNTKTRRHKATAKAPPPAPSPTPPCLRVFVSPWFKPPDRTQAAHLKDRHRGGPLEGAEDVNPPSD